MKNDIISLRREKLRLRAALSEHERRVKSAAIARQLSETESYRLAGTVLIYASYRDEVETEDMIKHALLDGKAVFCPKVAGREMGFYQIFSLEDLVSGFRGIPEPDGGSIAYRSMHKAGKRSGTLLVAPGTVFDPKGGRIGYGGGYYDRYLSGFPAGSRPVCAGICFSCQLTGKIPMEPHDIPMDFVLYA